MRHVYALTILGLAAAMLSACAPKLGFKAINPTSTGGANGELITGGINENAVPYTSFSPLQETTAAREEGVATEENVQFAANILTAKATVLTGKLQIQIQWKNLKEPLTFEGVIGAKSDSGSMVTEIIEKSNQLPQLNLAAECADSDCYVVHAVLKNAEGQKASFIIRKEQRTLRLKVPESQKKNAALLSPATQQKMKEQEQGKAVIVTSTEIYPGRSSFEIAEVENTSTGLVQAGLIRGDLLATTEGAAAVESIGEFANLGTGELVGNSNDGELVFRYSQTLYSELNNSKAAPAPATSTSTERILPTDKVTNLRETPIRKILPLQVIPPVQPPPPKKVVSYLVLEPRVKTAESSATPNADAKNVDVSGKDNHPLVRQILADSSREEVKNYIAKHISITTTTARNGQKQDKMGDFFQKTKVYIACHKGDLKTCGKDAQGQQKAQTVAKIKLLLERENLPSAVSIVALIESFYEPTVESGAGALGWWQFMPDTGRGLGLRIDRKNHVDERKDLTKSTLAAAKYLKDLLIAWKGDLKMSLASYNRGEGAMRRSCLRRIQTDLCRSGQGKGTKFEDMKDMLEISNNDFWKFYSHNFIPAETQNYVLKFLSGNLVAHSPRDYGMDYDAVDLN